MATWNGPTSAPPGAENAKPAPGVKTRESLRFVAMGLNLPICQNISSGLGGAMITLPAPAKLGPASRYLPVVAVSGMVSSPSRLPLAVYAVQEPAGGSANRRLEAKGPHVCRRRITTALSLVESSGLREPPPPGPGR